MGVREQCELASESCERCRSVRAPLLSLAALAAERPEPAEDLSDPVVDGAPPLPLPLPLPPPHPLPLLPPAGPPWLLLHSPWLRLLLSLLLLCPPPHTKVHTAP